MEPIIIIQHAEDDPPATIAAFLTVEGLPFEVRRVDRGASLPSLREFSALIVLGGAMHTHQTAEYPFLEAELDLLRGCLGAEAAVLGICLGAQLLAAAAGAEVYLRARPEIGWLPVEVVARDPLFCGISSPFVCLQWHDYSFRLPPGALRIAAGGDGEQAFRLGRTWAVQFHPEVGAAEVERWTRMDEARLRAARTDWPAQIRADSRTYLPAYPSFCRRLVGNFLSAAGLLPYSPKRPASGGGAR